MATRTRLTGVGSRVWRILAMVVLIGAALAVSTDHSQAEAPVDVVITDTSFTLSWSADGDVKFYWWQPIAGKLERITVSGAKSWTATGLQPESEHEFSFFGAFYGSLKFKTKASGDPPPPPPPTPEVSIAAGADITEGSNATFTLTATPIPTQSISVSVAPSQSGNYGVGSTAKTVTVGTSGTATVTFSTTNDSIDEADGSVMATVDSGTGYTVSSSKGSATLAVADDDVPELSIASAGDVIEGSAASFTISASPTPHSALSVDVGVSASGSFGVTTGTQTMTVPASGTKTFTVSTSGDTTDEPDGSVTVTLGSGTGYDVSSSADSATAAIADDDVPPSPDPVVSITAGSAITEGSDATYTISVTPTQSATLDVSVTVSQTGAYASTGQQTVTIPTSGSYTLTVSTTNDSTDEPDGSIVATIDSGTGYTVSSSNGHATVAVSDDDDPPQPEQAQSAQEQIQHCLTGNILKTVQGYYDANKNNAPNYGENWKRVLITFHDVQDENLTPYTAAEALESEAVWFGWKPVREAIQCIEIVFPAPSADPEISIASSSDINEGGTVTFTLTATPAPTADISVSVTVTQSGSYTSQAGARTVTITSTGTALFTVTTLDDSSDEPDGSVTATVNTGTGYTVSSSAASTTANVSDDDDPEVSITAGSAITEGGDATFTVSVSPTQGAALDVSVTVSQSGDFATTGQQTVTIPTSGTYTLTVSTTDDSTDESDGSVTATIDSGTGYTVSSTAGSATLAVADDDDLPAKPDTDTDTETDTTSTTCELPADAITADEVTGWRDALDPNKAAAGIARWNRILEALGVDTGSGVTAMTADQAQDVADWLGNTRWDRTARTLAAQDDCDAEPSPQPLQQSTPEISISSGSDVTEGGDIAFTLTATPAPTSDMSVSVTVTESESFTSHGQTGTRTVTMTSAGTASFTVTTIDDSSDDFAGTITATVNTGTGYTVSSTAGSTYANVYDNDDPTVFVNAGSAITEGMRAVFKFQVSATQTVPITVNLTVSQSGNFVTTGQRTITISTSGIYHLIVPTTDNSTEDPAGSVTVTINPGAGYTGAGTATVKVADNDKPLMGRALASSTCVSKSLKEQVRDYHYDNRKKPPDHGLNWWRVRTAFADAPGSKYPPYTATEASANEATWSGWTPVRKALECIETKMGGPPVIDQTHIYQIIPGAGLIDPPNRRNHLFRSHDPALQRQTFKIKLRQQPPQDVTVRPTFGEGEGMRWFKQALVIDPPTLTFTISNWKDFQSFTVTAKPDFNLSDEQFDMKFLIEGPPEAKVIQTRLFFINSDNEVDLVKYDPRGTRLKLFEGSDGLEYKIKLGGVPDSPAVITFTSADSSAVTVSPSKLTFDLDNWDEWQTVTITAIHDGDARHENASIIVRTKMPGNRVHYTPKNPSYRHYTSRIYVKTLDDELADVLLNRTELKLIEGRTTGTYTVRLNTDPGGTVTVTPGSGDTSHVKVSGPLTFNSNNWRQEQTVTVTSVQDGDDENDVVTITHTIGNYGGTAPDVTVRVTDDDHAAEVQVSLERMAMNEGQVKSYAVWIKSDPGDGNTVTVTPKIINAGRQLEVQPKKLTFTGGDSGNWTEKRQIAVDAWVFVEPKGRVFTITHAVSGNGVGYPSNMTLPDVLVGVADDWWKLTIEFDRDHNLELTEGHASGVPIGVRLSYDPGAAGWDENNGDSAEGTVTLQTHPMGNCLVADPATLTFTTGPKGNWKTYQTLTIKPKIGCPADAVNKQHWIKVSLGMAPYELKFLPGYRSTTKDVVTRSIDVLYREPPSS